MQAEASRGERSKVTIADVIERANGEICSRSELLLQARRSYASQQGVATDPKDVESLHAAVSCRCDHFLHTHDRHSWPGKSTWQAASSAD